VSVLLSCLASYSILMSVKREWAVVKHQHYSNLMDAPPTFPRLGSNLEMFMYGCCVVDEEAVQRLLLRYGRIPLSLADHAPPLSFVAACVFRPPKPPPFLLPLFLDLVVVFALDAGLRFVLTLATRFFGFVFFVGSASPSPLFPFLTMTPPNPVPDPPRRSFR